MNVVDLTGWVFVAMIIVGYWLAAVKDRPVPFMWINVVAMFVVGYINFRQEAWQGLGLNLIFGFISIWGLLKIAVTQRKWTRRSLRPEEGVEEVQDATEHRAAVAAASES